MGTSGPALALAVVTGLGPVAAGGHRAPAAAMGPGPVVEPPRAGLALAGPDQICGVRGGRGQQLARGFPGPAGAQAGRAVGVGDELRELAVGGQDAVEVV